MNRSALRLVRQLIEGIALALIPFLIIQLSLQPTVVQGFSMAPTLDDGSHLMVNKMAYFQVDVKRLSRLIPFWDVIPEARVRLPFSHPPRRGDVIVFHDPTDPSQDLVKRVVGLPGEKVQVRAGTLYIDGAKLAEPYLRDIHPTGSMKCIPNSTDCTLQEGQYFVMGDNRVSSLDSRQWGPVPIEDIVGKVWFTY